MTELYRQIIALPELDWQKKNWTLGAQIKKMNEELGEVAEALIESPHNDDVIIPEILDFIQTGKTLLDMFAAEGVNVDWYLNQHIKKLQEKGYLKFKGGF